MSLPTYLVYTQYQDHEDSLYNIYFSTLIPSRLPWQGSGSSSHPESWWGPEGPRCLACWGQKLCCFGASTGEVWKDGIVGGRIGHFYRGKTRPGKFKGKPILVHTPLCIIVYVGLEGKHEKEADLWIRYIYIYIYQPIMKLQHRNPSKVTLIWYCFLLNLSMYISPGRRAEIPSMIWISSSELRSEASPSGDPHWWR